MESKVLRRALACALLCIPVFALAAANPEGPGKWTKSAYSEEELRGFEHPDEKQVRELREQEVNELRIALGRRSPEHRRADLYLRLAEIYMEAYHTEFLLEGRAHEARLSAGKKDLIIDRVHSRVYLADGIKACKEILSSDIRFDKLDEVYYFLAFNFGELGQRKDSLYYFDKLIHDFPSSPMISEGYRQFGEAAYDQRDFPKALEYFQRAEKKAAEEELPTILHKEAWAYYRTRQYDRAVDTMKRAIDIASKHGEKFLNLKEEALRDMAVFMTEAGRADEAITYFQKVTVDKSFYPKLLERLGREYEHNAEPGKASQVYESLLKTGPDPETRFRVMVKLVELELRRAKFKNALDRVHSLTEPENPKDADTQIAVQNLRAIVRKTATENHEHYRKSGSRPSLELAEEFYGTYLNQFLKKSDPRHETPEIEMYLAEVKRDLGKSQEASELYRQVLETRDPRYTKEAGGLWTASLSDAIRKNSKSGKTSLVKPQEPSALEKEFIEASDRMAEALGDTSDGRDAELKAAEVEAGYRGTQDSAIHRIKELIKKSPKSQQALTGAHLWVQIDADQLTSRPEVASELRDTISSLSHNDDLMGADQEIGQGKLRAMLVEQETRLKVNAIATNEKEKNYTDAAKGYESFAQQTQDRDIAEKSYANALLNYVKSQDIENADRVSSEWLKRYPGSEKALGSIRSQATQLLIAGQFEAAANQFSKIGSVSNDPEALQTAARIYAGMGTAEAAQASWHKFLEKYPRSSDRPQVVLSLAKSYEAQRDDANAAKYYRICESLEGFEAECGGRLGDLYEKGENFGEAKVIFKKVAAGSHGRHKEAGSPWVAYARFRLAERMEKDSHFVPLELPEKNLKKALEQRTGFLEPLSRAYMSAEEAGGPWAIAALDALAEWGMHFADEIDSIAPPPNSKPESIQRFQASLRNLSEPLRRKGVATWTQAYTKAVSAEIYSPALPEIADHLADFHANSPTRAQGYRGKFRLAGEAADGGVAALEKVRDKLSKNSQNAGAWIDYGNLIWGSGKSDLAQLIYDYALSLSPKSPAALNNRGVLAVNEGEEDWTKAYEGAQYFHSALKKDEFFLPAKMNLAVLMNYYRLFSKAKPYWAQISTKAQSADVEDGHAIALQGSGDLEAAEAGFKRAVQLGAPANRFAGLYHEAARQSFGVTSRSQAGLAATKCLDTLNEMSEGGLGGFEKNATDHLKRACTQWKDGN